MLAMILVLTVCYKDLEKGNSIDGVDMLDHNELEQGTSNVGIHSLQTSESEAAETSNMIIDNLETSDSEVDSFKPNDSKVAKICTESPYRVNSNDPNGDDSSHLNKEQHLLLHSSFLDFHDLPVSKYVLKRPGMDEFLSKLAEKYEVVVFTESPRQTTICILDRLDINHRITRRFYGDSCKSINGNFVVKDLSVLGKDMGSVLIIDDNTLCYSMQPRNAVAIKSFG
ncbi:hypothetical protein SUGI_0248160 [Cryptomeria japonica]|nr:hypothetical protein SUGI_0248160 [Cryptomeria japonica]